MTFEDKLHEHAEAVNRLLQALLASEVNGSARPSRLGEAMRYGVLDGGKRFRPFLVLETAHLFDAAHENALYAAAAVECIHCYSLIHDDLPAMDDDAMRRGRPTVHVEFDEATAILAGDALHSFAFEILADPKTHQDAELRARLSLTLAQAAGRRGMAGGQDLDLQAAHRRLSQEEVQKLQLMKTGALIQWCCEAGGLLGGADDTQLAALCSYARCLGLGFQVADDLLDLEGDEGEVGKDVRKDLDAGKATLIAHLGVGGAKDLLKGLETAAVESLEAFGEKADGLRAAARFATHRRH